MKFKNLDELYNNLGQCIHCQCYVSSKNAEKDCIRNTGHNWFIPYDDLIDSYNNFKKEILKGDLFTK